MSGTITRVNNDIITTYQGQDAQGDTGDSGVITSLAEINAVKGALLRKMASYDYTFENQNQILRCVHHDNFQRADNPSAIGENSMVVGKMPYNVIANSLLIGIINNTAYCSNYSAVPNRGYALVTRNGDWVAEIVPVSGYRTAVVLDYVDGNNFVFSEIYPPSAGTIRVKTMRYTTGTLQPTVNDSYIPTTNVIYISRTGNTFTLNNSNSFTFTISDLTAPTQMGLMFGWSNDYRVDNFNLYYNDKYVTIPLDDALEPNYLTYFTTQNASKPYSVQVVSDVTNNSQSALRFELHDDDGLSNVGSVRTEIAINNASLIPNNRALYQMWTSFDVYFPLDYNKDSDYESFYQIHDEQENWTGMPGHSPIFALLTYNDMIYLDVRSKVDKDYSIAPPPTYYPYYLLGAVPKGKWTNIEIKLKLRYDSNLSPQLLIMFNGSVVANLNVPNCYNTVPSGYQKFGIYKWTWATNKTQVSKRVLYYDNIKVLI